MNAPQTFPIAYSLDDRYRAERGLVYLSGTQALVRLMLDQQRQDARAGLNTAGFVSGYPGSPVGQVDDEMIAARSFLDRHQVVFQPGQNEELAATAVFGTQALHEVPGARYDGVFAMWYGKAPGVDRTGDAFHHHNFRGVPRHGGVLAVAGDDPHARSTIFPSDSNAAFYKFFMPLLAPANVQEVIDLGLHGYALSRASGLWVGMKFVTDVADSAGVAEVGRPHPTGAARGVIRRPDARAGDAHERCRLGDARNRATHRRRATRDRASLRRPQRAEPNRHQPGRCTDRPGHRRQDLGRSEPGPA
ncbi:MAG: hypothetical protein R3E83_18190 [Burkholderiaceae bacterium]